ncbi:MAG: type II secretion system protein [Verrucomicrobiota bacterium]
MKIENVSESRSISGFTFTELVVVLAVLTILVAMILPALANTQTRTQRAICLNNLRQLGIAVTVFSTENNDTLPVARSASVQIALDPISAPNAAKIGLTLTNPASFWTCPNRPGLPFYEAAFNQWTLGYQYFGGISNWVNTSGTYASRSPIKLSLSKPHWTMAADAVIKLSGVWGGSPTSSTYTNIPPHHTGDSFVPQGGNQVFMDGSAQWIQFEKMYFLHSWSSSTRVCYFYQDPKDFDAALVARLALLQATP